MHSFYKNKKPGKQHVLKKKDANKGSGGVGGTRRRCSAAAALSTVLLR
jgi:hypothetical protein